VNSPVFATLTCPTISASLRAEILGNSEQIGGPLATLSAKDKRLKAAWCETGAGMGSCVNISNYNIVDRSESGVDFRAGGWSYTQQMIFETRLLDSTILPWQKAEKGAKSNPPRIPP